MKSFIVLILAVLADVSLQTEWSYNYETQWPGECRNGAQQSPVNIMSRSAVIDHHQAHIRGPLHFRGYGDVRVSGNNDGHTLRWNADEDSPAPIVSGGPLRGNYTFMQFHLHWLSEHAIDGMKYPLEIHMVHIKTGLTLDEATARPDGLTVIGVLAQVHSEETANFALEEIMPEVPSLFTPTDEPTESHNIDISRMFSPNTESYYTYHGSLTTPNCQEVVTWIVMDTPIFISDQQYKVISQVNVGGINNYRSLQASTGRAIYRSVASCSSILVPGLFGSLAVVLHCISSSIITGIKKGMCLVSNAKRKIFGDNIKECAKVL